METIKLKFRRGIMIEGSRVGPGAVSAVPVGLARELLQRGVADVHDESAKKGAAKPSKGKGEGDANPEA